MADKGVEDLADVEAHYPLSCDVDLDGLSIVLRDLELTIAFTATGGSMTRGRCSRWQADQRGVRAGRTERPHLVLSAEPEHTIRLKTVGQNRPTLRPFLHFFAVRLVRALTTPSGPAEAACARPCDGLKDAGSKSERNRRFGEKSHHRLQLSTTLSSLLRIARHSAAPPRAHY